MPQDRQPDRVPTGQRGGVAEPILQRTLRPRKELQLAQSHQLACGEARANISRGISGPLLPLTALGQDTLI